MVIHISYGVYYETFLPLYHRSLCSRPNSNKDSNFTSNFTDIYSSNICFIPEETDFLTYKMIKNTKLPETFRREYSVSVSYHFSK